MGGIYKKLGVSLANWSAKGYVLIWAADLKTDRLGGLGFSPLARIGKPVGRHNNGSEKLIGVE